MNFTSKWHIYVINSYITAYLGIGVVLSIQYRWYTGLLYFMSLLILSGALSLPFAHWIFPGRFTLLRWFETIKGLILLFLSWYYLFELKWLA